MCSHYQAIKARERLRRMGITVPENYVPPNGGRIYKHCLALFIINPTGPLEGVTGEREGLIGQFALQPAHAEAIPVPYETMNARAEEAYRKRSLAAPWRDRHCIVPADWIYEPDWRSGKSVNTRIARADGEPMGIAGLWDLWTNPKDGQVVYSFTLLTVNADAHPLMRNFHRPGKEKRMVVTLHETQYDAWLAAPANESMAFMQQFPAEELVAMPEVESPAQTALF